MTSERNLCRTIEARPMYLVPACPVGQPSAACPDDDRIWNWRHAWSGAHRTGPCMNCGQTLKQLRVRLNPQTGEPVRKPRGLAREIAMGADVAPVRFIGGPTP